MKIIYTPQDNPEAREEIDADLTSLWVGEVKLLEKTLKMTFQEIGEALTRGSATHLMAIVWIYRRRQNTDLRIDDMDDTIRLSELEIRADDEDEAEGEDDPKDSAAPSTPATPVSLVG
jgi:hypothetical protein